MQNKERAGEERRRWSWKKSGLSMEYKSASKSFAASFKKSDLVEVDDDETTENERDLKTGKNDEATCRPEQMQEGNENLSNPTMDSLKGTTGKAGGKVADISSKTLWVKDKVANLWSRKNKGDESERNESQNETEMMLSTTEQGITEDVHENAQAKKVNLESDISNKDASLAEKSQEEILLSSQEFELEETKETDKEIKDKKTGKAKTGWIRDHVSNLISKGRNYTSGSGGHGDKENSLNAEESKLGETCVGNARNENEDSNLALSMMEHYTLKQKEEENLDSVKEQEAKVTKPLPSPKPGDKLSLQDKFSEMHESINKKMLHQTDTVSSKETLKNNITEDRPSSPHQTSVSTPASKSSSKKSKLKDFLNARPPTTDLTHLPPPMSDKNGKDKMDTSPSLKTQAKKKFKFSTKLSFSELLHSQEAGQISPEQDSKGNDHAESLSASPIFNRIDEQVSSDEEIVDVPYKENTHAYTSVSYTSSVTYFRLWVLSVVLYAYTLIPTHVFLNGLILGALVMYLGGCLVVWLFCPSGKSIEQYKLELKNYMKEQDKSSPLRKPARPMDPKALQKPRDLKGWVHFLVDYEPRVFTLDSTKDVYAVLRGEVLYILFCKAPPEMNVTPQKIKKMKRGLRRRRKRNDLQTGEPVFVFEKEHRIMLPSCGIDLCPLDLPMRRIWNRKYPIRLEVPANAIFTRDIDIPFEELTANFDEFFDSPDAVWTAGSVDEKFHIFPNTSREKEDWFYRMQLCVKPLKHQVTFNDLRKGLSSAPIDSYPHYMTERIRESEKVTSRVINGKKLEPHSAWLNVLLGRAFWDVWHEQYWKRKVWQKIQNRLSKLNTPPIIKEIFVKDLNLGHTLPIIHRGTLPEIDEYGVWTDLQVTYQGEFTLTLETQLNVDFYVTLLTKIAKNQTQGAEGHNSTDGVRMRVVREKNDEDYPDNLTEASYDTSVSGADSTDIDGGDVLDEQIPEIFLEAMDNVAVDEEDLGAALDDDPLISDPRTKAFLESKTGKRVIGVVGWLARSKIAKKVAGTDFAKRAYEKAYEKFRKMPITLKVTVQSLKGTLAVNIPPPPSNRLWFGFRGSPALLITAHPKLGERHVRLTYLTDWIEKKLKEEFKKLFVLPSMQDLSVKMMYSRLEDLYPERPLS